MRSKSWTSEKARNRRLNKAEREYAEDLRLKRTRHTDFWSWLKEHNSDLYWECYMKGIEASETQDNNE